MLTDREREKLLQIERYIADEDPRLARLLSYADGLHRHRRVRVWHIALLILLVSVLVGFGLGVTG